MRRIVEFAKHCTPRRISVTRDHGCRARFTASHFTASHFPRPIGGHTRAHAASLREIKLRAHRANTAFVLRFDDEFVFALSKCADFNDRRNLPLSVDGDFATIEHHTRAIVCADDEDNICGWCVKSKHACEYGLLSGARRR